MSAADVKTVERAIRLMTDAVASLTEENR
jgi:hypothetical protein